MKVRFLIRVQICHVPLKIAHIKNSNLICSFEQNRHPFIVFQTQAKRAWFRIKMSIPILLTCGGNITFDSCPSLWTTHFRHDLL